MSRSKLLTGLLLWFVLLIGINYLAQAQPATTPQKIDSLTLKLYNEGQWDELIVEGSKAIASGLDYYYMQMRVGIAWYETGNYRKAIPFFRAALKLNPTSQTTLEYLYFSYLFSGRKYDADRIAPKLSKERKQKIGIDKSQILDFIYFETGPGSALNDDPGNWMKKRNTKYDSIYSKAYISDDLYYLHGGINFKIHPNISVYQGYSKVNASLKQRINYLNVPWPDFETRVHQHEYYGNMSLAIPTGIKVTSAWHLLWINYDDRIDRYNDSLFILEADTLSFKRNEFTFLLSARKDFDLFALQMDASLGDLNGNELNQVGLLFYTYPFGSLNLYTETGIFKIWDQSNREDWIFHQMVGVKLSPQVWFEASATIGNLRDYNEGYAFTVYNTPNNVNYKLEGNFLIEVSKHINLSFRGRYMERQVDYLYYNDFETSETITRNLGYFSIIGGIKWIF